MKTTSTIIFLTLIFFTAACSRSSKVDVDPLQQERSEALAMFNSWFSLQATRAMQQLHDQEILESKTWSKPYPCGEGGITKTKMNELAQNNDRQSAKNGKTLDLSFEWEKCSDLDFTVTGNFNLKSTDDQKYKPKSDIVEHLERLSIMDGKVDLAWKDKSGTTHVEKMEFQNVKSHTLINGSKAELFNNVIRQLKETKEPSHQAELNQLVLKSTVCSGKVITNGVTEDAKCTINGPR